MNQEILRINLGGVNAYLGKQNGNFILFDTGGHMTTDKEFDGRRGTLKKELDRAGCTPDTLKLIVLTHGDNDHAANAKYISDTYHAKIAMHADDLDLVQNPTVDLMMRSFQYSSPALNLVFKIMKKQIRKINEKVLNDFEKFTPDILLKEGDSLSAFGFDAEILHVPGHTEGSVGILTSGGDLIAGDTFVNLKKPAPALNAVDFNGLHKSVEKLKARNIKTVYPGHGTPFAMKDTPFFPA